MSTGAPKVSEMVSIDMVLLGMALAIRCAL